MLDKVKCGMLIMSLMLAATSANAKNYQCQVIYKGDGATVGWTVTAKGKEDAVNKWKTKIQKGKMSRTVISVKCK